LSNRILDIYDDRTADIDAWLPVDSIASNGVASITPLFLCGPGEVLPISEDGGEYARQVVKGPPINVDIRDGLIDFVVSQLDVDEAGTLAVLGVASRANIDCSTLLDDFNIIPLGFQLYVEREIVILSYEKAYPNAENRESLDISALGAAEKGKSVATLDSEYDVTPQANGLTWREFCAAFHVNIEAYNDAKLDCLTVAKAYIDANY
jgi:hypothetical protein